MQTRILRGPYADLFPRGRQTVNQPAGAATPGMVIAEIRFWRGTPTQPGTPDGASPRKAADHSSSP
jgi:hypothetical protein